MKGRYRLDGGVICLMLLPLLLVAVAGCGAGQAVVSGEQADRGAGDQEAVDVAPAGGSVGGVSEETRPVTMEEEVGSAAIYNAGKANPGSEFKVVDLKVIDGWARVGLEETGIPRDEAVRLTFYLRRYGGDWDLMTCGNRVSASTLPEAPRRLFD